MKINPSFWPYLVRNGLASLLLSLVWVGFRFANTAPPDWAGFLLFLAGIWLFFLFNAGLARLPMRVQVMILVSAAVAGWGIYTAWSWAGMAAIALLALWSWLFWLGRCASGKLGRRSSLFWILLAGLALLAGFLPVTIDQIAGKFSEEEFFMAIRGVQLTALWGIAWFAWDTANKKRTPVISIPPRWFWWGAGAILAGLAVYSVLLVRAYQTSFYPQEAPQYPGIGDSSPFACGVTEPAPVKETADTIYKKILDNVASNPDKQTPEYGMLALGTEDAQWGLKFHDALLKEVEEGQFTGPAGSVKFGQYDAALRAYYYPLVLKEFPQLFTPAQQADVLAWFANINRRALTVEWVDWLYAIAFDKIPEGPYENQENGAGLLSLLEVNHLAAPELEGKNREYLDPYERGWLARFNNTDDAIEYQPLWINNAYFQSFYYKDQNAQNLVHSFELLAAQALPDGQPYGYNHPFKTSLAGPLYLGAVLTGRGDFLGLAGKQIEAINAQGITIPAQPGAEKALPAGIEPATPNFNSCLIYAGSGLPNQPGPLAPDKIVLRDGWNDQDTFLLLNLRFTGWHRFKATNTVTLFYQNAPILQEPTNLDRIGWLPVGRSHVRDKRIPREALNGLVVERQGLSRILYELTGDGGLWAQDPPYYAAVESFETSAQKDYVLTRMGDWHGWTQTREITHFREPITSIVDYLESETGGKAAILWHVPGDASGKDERLTIQENGEKLEILRVPLQNPDLWNFHEEMQGGLKTLYAEVKVRKGGNAGLATLILSGKWLGANARIETRDGKALIVITKPGAETTIPLIAP